MLEAAPKAEGHPLPWVQCTSTPWGEYSIFANLRPTLQHHFLLGVVLPVVLCRLLTHVLVRRRLLLLVRRWLYLLICPLLLLLPARWQAFQRIPKVEGQVILHLLHPITLTLLLLLLCG